MELKIKNYKNTKVFRLKFLTFNFLPLTSLRKAVRGQAMPYFFMMMVVLVLCWAMIVNIAKLVKDRMMMQNAADNAALSVAVYKARVLNKLGELNFLIGCALYGTEYGITTYHPIVAAPGVYGVCTFPAWLVIPNSPDNQQKVAFETDSCLPCSGTDNQQTERSMTVSAIRNMVKGMVTVQDSLRLPFPGLAVIYANKIAKKQEINANDDECGADLVAVTSGLSLGLERNENGIKYFKTKTTCISIPPIPIVLPPGLHIHISWQRITRKNRNPGFMQTRTSFTKIVRLPLLPQNTATRILIEVIR